MDDTRVLHTLYFNRARGGCNEKKQAKQRQTIRKDNNDNKILNTDDSKQNSRRHHINSQVDLCSEVLKKAIGKLDECHVYFVHQYEQRRVSSNGLKRFTSTECEPSQ